VLVRSIFQALLAGALNATDESSRSSAHHRVPNSGSHAPPERYSAESLRYDVGSIVAVPPFIRPVSGAIVCSNRVVGCSDVIDVICVKVCRITRGGGEHEGAFPSPLIHRRALELPMCGTQPS
jgi:hypothetical protein